ncbi:hypothetical protein A2U01_0077062, partial [Trifolium medium]|nr:hypothetical protein [Trifolium medium]
EFWGDLVLKPPLCSQEQGKLAQRAYQRAMSLSLVEARNFQVPARVSLAQRAWQNIIFCFGILMALRASMGL